ncbi:MAG TPA: ATP-binding protein [Terriglobales bacterium]|nr:ATP-binding protein [Terriglobales bacterium]
MKLIEKWWAAGTATLLVVYGAVSLLVPRGRLLLTTASDFVGLGLLLLAAGLMLANAFRNRGHARAFWALMATGCFMWAVSQGGWAYYEVILRRELPDPYFGDIILFLHIVPMMAAVALRPHRAPEERNLHFLTLNLVMLLVWWVFLYAFVVFPDEYVVLRVPVYSKNYDILYLLEALVLIGSLAALAAYTHGSWKKIYLNLLIATSVYTLGSELMNAAILSGQYYSGSAYDLLFITSLCLYIRTALLAREQSPEPDATELKSNRWLSMAPRLAMLAILSLPIMGLWAMYGGQYEPRLRHFRLLVTLAAMLVLGLFVFVRQFFLDRELVRLLSESHRSLENLQRLQSQVVQKEKLASLGQLVAGAAHEINNPLTAILGYSELLMENSNLGTEQVSMARKIGQQARRTRDLVSGLLSFAQQSPSAKVLVNAGALLQRAVQLQLLPLESKRIRVETQIDPELPKILGDSNQLLQCFVEIIGNASDALEGVGGGLLNISAWRESGEIVLEFADSGPGIREPRRVFDPFYTTKPIGKGTGLGLSVTYGLVQDHGGQITCFNRPEGGAVFVLRFPASAAVSAPA